MNEEVGTAVFDEYPEYEEWIKEFEFDKPADMMKLMKPHFSHLPVWIDGNGYFNGAVPYKNEKNSLVDNQNEVYVELVEDEGKYSLKTNIYEFLDDFNNDIITTEFLGKAFEPEQRFENPDGSEITFNEDYFGNHRGLKTMPGPFATSISEEDL